MTRQRSVVGLCMAVLLCVWASSASAQITNNGRYKVVNKNSSKCVDAAANGTANGTVVQQYTCNGTAAQTWQLTATDSGYYKVLTANNTAQGWDVTGGTTATADGVKIQLWTNSGTTNEQWQPISEGAGYYHLVVRNSGKCLDVPSASTADAVQLQQWTCNGSAAQSFQLASTTGATPTATSPGATATPTPTTSTGGTNIARGRAATASSSESATYAASMAVDGNTGTRWSSAFADPQWIRIDLGATANINRVVLNWEAAFGKSFQIQTSNDGATWATVYTTTAGAGGVQSLTVSGSGRYVRMYGTARGTAYGYSLWEFEVYGTYTGATPTLGPTATPTPTQSTGGGGTRFSAPYQPVWSSPNLANLATSTGNKFWTLAFIINGSGTCNPTWNGDTALSNTWNVAGLRSMGGDVIVSFGGAAGVEIAASCPDVASTQNAIQQVINAMGAKMLDFDIESGYESQTASIDRRNKALHNLQVNNPGLRVDYTLAVDRSGLPAAQIALLNNAKSNGVTVSSVNIMAMDYGPCYTDMGQAAIDAANATKNQLAANGINAKVGITPMIGQNDTACENFTTNDASILTNWAQGQTFVNLLAYWDQDADTSHSYINIFKTFH
jgi:hypothetical protein